MAKLGARKKHDTDHTDATDLTEQYEFVSLDAGFAKSLLLVYPCDP
jgi:hypothetical protein